MKNKIMRDDKKILFFAGIYENNGIGNFVRMFQLYKYFHHHGYHVSFFTNNISAAHKILSMLNEPSMNFLLEEKYDICIIDSPKNENYLVSTLDSYLVALDTFENYKSFDLLIDLYSHHRKNIEAFSGNIYEGLKYAILKDEFLSLGKSKIENNKARILVTFGGEDPDSLSLKVLKKLYMFKGIKVTVVIGVLNRDHQEIMSKYTDIFDIMESTDKMHEIMHKQDLIICGGGTTLLEAVYVGNPIIAIGQNRGEKDFIYYVQSQVPLYKLEEIATVIPKLKDQKYRDEIFKSYRKTVDGKGKQRIKELVLKKVEI